MRLMDSEVRLIQGGQFPERNGTVLQFVEPPAADEDVPVGVKLFHAQRFRDMERKGRNHGKIYLAIPHCLDGILGAVV